MGLLAWVIRRPFLDPLAEVAYLAASLAAVLLAGPLTWTMNAVWLVVGGILLARAWPPARSAEKWALLGLAFGLLLAWLPDQYALGFLFASPPGLGDYKYVAGELVVLLALSSWIRTRFNEPAPRTTLG